jgi:hypothetical protein
MIGEFGERRSSGDAGATALAWGLWLGTADYAFGSNPTGCSLIIVPERCFLLVANFLRSRSSSGRNCTLLREPVALLHIDISIACVAHRAGKMLPKLGRYVAPDALHAVLCLQDYSNGCGALQPAR